MLTLIKIIFISIFLGFCSLKFKQIKSNEIVQDKNGNFYLIKKDGSYKKLPPPKPGHKYVIKNVDTKKNNSPKKNILNNKKRKKEKRDTRSAKRNLPGIK